MLCLQEMAKKGQHNKIVTLNERLPHFITGPCTMDLIFEVEAREDFYLIHLEAKGRLPIQCQRCLDKFDFSYENKTEVAVCSSEKRAEKLLEQYECTVSETLQISLEEVLIDELHLYAPQFHATISDCNNEINQFLAG